MLQDKVERVRYSLSKGFVLKNVFAPIRELQNYPDAFASKLEVSATYVPILLMIVLVFFGHFGWVLVCDEFELFNFFYLDNTLFEAVCHIIDEAVEELFESLSLHHLDGLLLELSVLPESLEYL